MFERDILVMKNSIASRATLGLLSAGAGLVVLFSGCSTPNEYSYNEEFHENLLTQPKYYIKDEDDRHFKIVVHQGSPSTEANRVIDQKQAATAVARAEAQRLGWDKWHLDYIQERDQGWMHVVIAKVTREVYVPQN
jgi:hypothetical protein